jgi:hypothetical protein
MRPIDFVLAIVFMAALGTGVTMTTTGVNAVEFWFARGCFVIAALAAMYAYFSWYSRNRPALGLGIKLIVGALAATVVVLGTPLSVYWIHIRELSSLVGPHFEFRGIKVENKNGYSLP